MQNICLSGVENVGKIELRLVEALNLLVGTLQSFDLSFEALHQKDTTMPFCFGTLQCKEILL